MLLPLWLTEEQADFIETMILTWEFDCSRPIPEGLKEAVIALLEEHRAADH